MWPDPIVLAAHCAALTTTVQLVFHVLVVPQRHPIITAKQIATLDALAPHRVSVGVGVGWLEEEFHALGVDFKHRREIADEHLAAMDVLWHRRNPSFEGQYVSFSDLVFEPKPTQAIPVLLAGKGHRVLKHIATGTAGWLPMTASPEEFQAARTALHRECESSGRDPMSIVVMAGIRLGGNGRLPTTAEAVQTISQWQRAGVTHGVTWFDWSSDAAYLEAIEWLTTEVMPLLQTMTDSRAQRAAAKPLSRSLRMSSIDSMPTLSRIIPGCTSEAFISSGVS
jgi:probable F420-dependent oxidoreductase